MMRKIGGAIPLERTRETGLLHVDGVLSMARGGPDTATGQAISAPVSIVTIARR